MNDNKLGEPVACLHRLVDVTNPVVKSGYMCMDCGAVFRAYVESKPKQEQGEPVAWIDDEGEFQWIKKIDNPEHTALYTTPQPAPQGEARGLSQQKPLTDEELKPHIEIAMKYYGYDSTKYGLTTTSGFVWLARAIEAAHGIKGES